MSRTPRACYVSSSKTHISLKPNSASLSTKKIVFPAEKPPNVPGPFELERMPSAVVSTRSQDLRSVEKDISLFTESE